MNYEQLHEQANEIEQGTAYIDTFMVGEERSRKEGGRRNVEASLLLGANERANSTESRREQRESQENILESYAKQEGIWLNPENFNQPIEQGSEALVFPAPNEGYVRKAVNYQIFSDTPLDFLNDRIPLYNYLFPDTAYKLLGFTRLKDMGKTRTPFCFIVEQPFIVGRKFNYNTDIEDFKKSMEESGFNLKIEFFKPLLINKEYVVKDLHEGNILVTKKGTYMVIDAVPYLNTAELNYGGTRMYGDGNVVAALLI